MTIDYNGTAATNSDFGRIVVAGNRTDYGDTNTRTVAVVGVSRSGR